MEELKIPMVEIFETVEGEGTQAGYPTVFVRLFGCNLRCTWCDTPYSYAPAKAEKLLAIEEIVEQVQSYRSNRICLTGGEPLMYGDKSIALIQQLAALEHIVDLHIETNGAIHLDPFLAAIASPKVRYIMDYKLPGSGENEQMLPENLALLRPQDELKFVIGSERDFDFAKQVLQNNVIAAVPLFSPVWETMPPAHLVRLLLDNGLHHVKLNMQQHKWIWDPQTRGV